MGSEYAVLQYNGYYGQICIIGLAGYTHYFSYLMNGCVGITQ